MSSAALDYWEKVYTDKDRNDGINEGRFLEKVNSIRSLMKSLKLTGEQAMDALFIPKEDRQKYMDRI